MNDNLTHTLNQNLCSILYGMFNMEFQTDSQFSRSNCLPHCQEIMSFIHFSGIQEEGDICLGMSHKHTRLLISQLISPRINNSEYNQLIATTVGEIANTLAGEFFSDSNIRKKYGTPCILPPLTLDDESLSNPSFPIIQGFCGKVRYQDIEIFSFISSTSPQRLISVI
ncbi:MAG: hypothetical protein HRT88_05460 [Lentisphaeraceae bacterium]|nr:hypothetical protein [Lentisphaeraceae bacterium]